MGSVIDRFEVHLMVRDADPRPSMPRRLHSFLASRPFSF
jgi:hypothetical protein